MFKHALFATTLAVSAGFAQAADVTMVSESFDNDYASLAARGWVIGNASSPVGAVTEGWFQGDSTFAGQAGGSGSYIGSSFAAAAPGGQLATWLISPAFSTAAAGSVSFWARSAGDAGYTDTLRFGLNGSASSATGSFTLSPVTTLGSTWTQYTLRFAGTGADTQARFAIEYLGAADTSDYVGVDSILVTAVPEPSTCALLGAGLSGLAWRRRRSATSKPA